MSVKQITAVTELDQSRYKTKVFAGGHLIYADEPAEMGGTDEGMTPAALLLASLGSCTAITIRMYADRKKWTLESITINLSIANEEEMNSDTTITRVIDLKGDLNDEQKERILLIANKCPIHKILSNPIKILTS